jgi:hypothetical protein
MNQARYAVRLLIALMNQDDDPLVDRGMASRLLVVGLTNLRGNETRIVDSQSLGKLVVISQHRLADGPTERRRKREF